MSSDIDTLMINHTCFDFLATLDKLNITSEDLRDYCVVTTEDLIDLMKWYYDAT